MSKDSINLYFCYSDTDERLLQGFLTHLSNLRRNGSVDLWTRRQIPAGTDISAAINQHIRDADIILIAVSPDILASEHFVNLELRHALARHSEQSARVVPLLLRDADWKSTGLGILQPLPRNGQTVSRSRNRDQIWLNVLQGLKELVDDLQKTRTPIPPSPSPEAFRESLTSEHVVPGTPSKPVGSAPEHWAPQTIRAFDRRMSRAFPGIRGVEKFTSGREIVSRLSRFFEEPPADSEFQHGLAWWFRGRTNDGIDRVRILSDYKILINYFELVPETLVVHRGGSLWHQLIYLRTAAESPARPHDAPKIPRKKGVIVREEYALWRDYPISAAEHEDGAAQIKGQLVDVQGAESRTRFLTPFNLLIAPQGTPLNDGKLDAPLTECMDGLLRRPAEVEKFLADLARLPRKYFQ